MASNGEDHEDSNLEIEIHDMITKLTDHLATLGHGNVRGREAEQGVRIITLAGENKGATMKADGLEELLDTHGALCDEDGTVSAYANCNYQAINNSMVVSGSCAVKDPGVHVVIVDSMDEHDEDSDDDDEDGDEKQETKDGDQHIKKDEKEELKKKESEKKGSAKGKQHSKS